MQKVLIGAALLALLSPLDATAADCGWSDWAQVDPIKCPKVMIRKKCHIDWTYAQLQFQNQDPKGITIVWQGDKGPSQTTALKPGLYTSPAVEAEAFVSCLCSRPGWFDVNIISATPN